MTESHTGDEQGEAREFLAKCCTELPSLEQKLSGVVGGREAVFLDLGARIQHFQTTAEGLGAEAEALTALASSDAVSEFARSLTAKLDEMAGQCSVLTGSSIQDRLAEVLDSVERLGEQIQGFSRVIRRLEMLGISTRIESARLGAEGLGFHTLADDVQKLADRIVLYSEQIDDKSQSLADLARSALGRAGSMRDMQKQCSDTLFTKLGENVDALKDLMESSRATSQALEPRSREIAGQFGEIVASLQFHDITRQQAEHVEEALATMLQVAGGRGEETRDIAPGEIVSWIADVCDLQASQLDNASTRLVQAVECIKENLVQVAEGVDRMAAMAGAVGRDEAGSGEFAFARIQEGIAHAVDTMRSMEEQGGAMAEVMVLVADTVSSMDAFVEDIENVGAEIELIAINASIKAARTGDKGRALGVLATSIQALSKEAGAMTDNVAGILRVIAEASGSLKKDTDHYLNATRVEGVVEDLQAMIASLRKTDSEVSALFLRMDAQSSDLSREARDLAQSIEFHREIAQELDNARQTFLDWGQDARAIWPHAHGGGESRLNALLERYTMEVERQVHESAFAQSDQGSERGSDLAAVPGDSDSGEDWDNVELF